MKSDNGDIQMPSGQQGPVDPMTTSEMLELTAVDAMGLLDDEDREAFDRAFAASPATLRDLIRSEQARVVDEIDFLPDVEPSARLRDRTLGHLADLIADARPGRAHRHSATASEQAASPARAPRLQRARRVNPVWRAAAVSLSVALVVVGVLHIQLRQQFDLVREEGRMANFIDAIGIEHIGSTLFSAETKRFQFTPVGDAGRGRAVLLYDPETDRARLYVLGLPTQQPFELMTVDANDRPVEVVKSFTPRGVLNGYDIDLSGSTAVRLAIVTGGETGRVLLIADVRLS